MKTILYNTENKKILGIFENGYLVDGKSQAVQLPIVELAFVTKELPTINYQTHRVKQITVVDLEAKTYAVDWEVTEKTAYEIAMESWERPEFKKRIIAPKQLVMDDIGGKMKDWFEINDFPIVKKETLVHLYCNVILEAHQSVIDSLQGYITIEDRPTE